MSSGENRRLAAERGESRFEGGPCAKCGGTTRYTGSGACVVCQVKHSTAYRRKFTDLLKKAKQKADAAKGE